MSLPINTLSSLLALQDVEDHKPRISKISWLADIFVFRSSILPIVLGPVLTVTIFSAGVAAASLWWGREVGLTNNVVPLLSVVVGLLLVFRNSTAYERYAEGRKDFTALISIGRNLSRNIWVSVNLPPTPTDGSKPIITKRQLTAEKRKIIRLVVAFVVATKHHLRAEGGVHHDDLKGLLPAKLAGTDIKRLKSTISDFSLRRQSAHPTQGNYSEEVTNSPGTMTPALTTGITEGRNGEDEESLIGVDPTTPLSPSPSMNNLVIQSPQVYSSEHGIMQNKPNYPRNMSSGLKRRPTAVRVLAAGDYHRSAIEEDITSTMSRRINVSGTGNGKERSTDERTPLIKKGVKPDTGLVRSAETGLGRMVEVGLPLIIAHEISRAIFRFRKMGCLEAVGPAGMNALQASVSGMTDQLGSMERIVQTPLPYIFCVHLKQVVSLYLFILPFTLVDAMGWKVVFIMFAISMTFMGIEGIASMIEQPFGTDPCDLNLDLYCTELLCECEAILERLPEGGDEAFICFEREDQGKDDWGADDGGDDD
ncbi:uncharacterized protein L201_003439 [Kwoniella dendrophila CBS 6074]|uniref:Bestrophin n=1 Tax=Kwoniella dendrophila CBS 6074 TaxID=1295534 RepID=A0AAX4JVI6_9TREE